MNLFSKLFHDLDNLTKTNDRLDRLVTYFETAPPQDALWVCWFLSGNRIKGAIKTGELRSFVAEWTALPLWLVEECHQRVGDLAETISLLVKSPSRSEACSLDATIRKYLLPLRGKNSIGRKLLLSDTWSHLSNAEMLPFHKLVTGGFRMGVSKGNLCKALARVSGVEPAIIAQRLAGDWSCDDISFADVISSSVSQNVNPYKPYPFCLASPVLDKVESLGSLSEWQVEWKWDGIRAQFLSLGGGRGMIWSRGEEAIEESFPELTNCLLYLPQDICLDGEILAWGHEGLRPFTRLQKRLGRKSPGPSILKKEPVCFHAYDLLRLEGEDLRGLPLAERRKKLEEVFEKIPKHLPLGLSEIVNSTGWDELSKIREESRDRGVEGFMVKRNSSFYESGRVKGSWYKWKVDPFLADMVVVSAQLGHGKRANLYSDYSLAVWDNTGDLVTVAKAYSGLTKKEIEEVDRYIRKNITGKYGPVRSVKPGIVFEVAFEGAQSSGRHKSGVALRFPRIHRWRKDKKPEEADSLDTIRGFAGIQDVSLSEHQRVDENGNLLLF
jgi:DNA ligase 1